jgi:putative chitinase
MDAAECDRGSAVKAPRVPAGFGIATPLRKAHFMAQVAHESGGFERLVENLNYSAKRIRQLGLASRAGSRWRSLVPRAASLGNRPEAFAEAVYGGRLGNRPEGSGDGWRFRGRGYIQITGRTNYAAASEALFGDDSLVREPELAALPENAIRIAAWFWQSRNCNRLADDDDIISITKAINGGLNGLADRARLLMKFKQEYGA